MSSKNTAEVLRDLKTSSFDVNGTTVDPTGRPRSCLLRLVATLRAVSMGPRSWRPTCSCAQLSETLQPLATHHYGRRLDDIALGSRKARTLLALLAARRGSLVASDAIDAALWPGGSPGSDDHDGSIELARSDRRDHSQTAGPRRGS